MRKLLLLITDGVHNHHPNCYKKKFDGASPIPLQFVTP